MRISNLAGFALGISAGLTALVGCGGGFPTAPPLGQPGAPNLSSRTPGFQDGRLNGFLAMHQRVVSRHSVTRPSHMDRRAVGKPLVFLSDNDGNVDIFLQSGRQKMVGQITGFTFADDLATDSAADLYVADYFSGNVIIFAPPYTNGPKLMFAAGFPQGVAVSRQGTVAVTSCITVSGSQCTRQGVLFYAPGSTTPCATVLVDQSVFTYIGLAVFDHQGNLYVDGLNSSPYAAVAAKIDGGCSAKKAKTLTISNTIVNPSSIKVDKLGRIDILNTTNKNLAVIDTYDAPKGGSLGSPISTTSLATPYYAGEFTFRPSGGNLWLSYESNEAPYGSEASEYAYPSGGAPGKTVVGSPSSVPFGVAVTPPFVP